MEMMNRDWCLVTGDPELEHLHTFSNFPVFMGCVDDADASKDITCDMTWWIAKKSGSIQMHPIPALELIYPTSHGSGTIGATWKLHHDQFADFVRKYAGNKILEIGGGHGFLALSFLASNPDADWTLIDPNPSCRPASNLKVIKGFFPVADNQQYDTIVHSHLFEHMLDPMDFCKQVGEGLYDGGYVIFSIPNLAEMINRQYTNILNFEHTFLLSEYFATYFLEATGFEVVEKKYYLEDHSIFFAARKIASAAPPELNNQYKNNRELYMAFILHHSRLIEKMNDIIQAAKGKIFLFGGHAMSQYLIAFGLDISSITCIVDNDSNKWGKRLNGSNLWVQSPECISSEEAPVVILRAGTFQSEIEAQLKKLNSSVVIVS